MHVTIIALCGFFVLFGYEMRYRFLREDLEIVKELMGALKEDVAKLEADIKMKQDIYKQFEGQKRDE